MKKKLRILSVLVLFVFIFGMMFNSLADEIDLPEPSAETQEEGAGIEAATDAETSSSGKKEQNVIAESVKTAYNRVLREYDEKAGGTLAEASMDTASLADGTPLALEEINGRQAIISSKQNGTINFTVDVATEGSYYLKINFTTIEGTGATARRGILIDGKAPFFEAAGVNFYRVWKNVGSEEGKTETFSKNVIGDEIRPKQEEVVEWQDDYYLEDTTGQAVYPYQFHFTPGQHTITFTYGGQDLAFEKIVLEPFSKPDTYKDVLEANKKAGLKAIEKTQRFEAESNYSIKNSSTLRALSQANPSSTPYSYDVKKMNVVGTGWAQGNQYFEWVIDVAEEGLYELGIRCIQNGSEFVPTYRQLKINGEVPFQEVAAYEFKYDSKFRMEVLSDNSGTPFLFKFNKGRNTLRLQCKSGELAKYSYQLNEDVDILSRSILAITKYVGATPDPNYDYNLFGEISYLEDNFKTISKDIQGIIDDYKKEISDKAPSFINNLKSIKKQIDDMVKKPENIAKNKAQLDSALGSLGGYAVGLGNNSVVIDYFLIGSSKAEPDSWKTKNATFFQILWSTIYSTWISFFKDYDAINATSETGEIDTMLNVWIARGTEWAEVTESLVSSTFTKEKNIAVSFNVVPPSQLNAGAVNVLMLSLISGKAPDLVMGSDTGSPVELAIRNASYNLKTFDDYDEVAGRFLDAIHTPFKYKDGVYALPETMNFQLMFYRKDIMEAYDMPIPETRQEIYDKVLPILYKNKLQFYYPADHSQFIFQYGGSYYTEDGLRSGLGTQEVFQALSEEVALFESYGFPLVANFFNRFRTGGMPIGLAGFDFYIQILNAAPEITGKWGVAPLPGRERTRENGETYIDRSMGGVAASTVVIPAKSQHPKEAWEFAKWWTSEETQKVFGWEIEALIGPTARWNSANLNAFKSLDWKDNDIDVIMHQLSYTKEVPVVLGGYFTGRHITNAWNRVIMSKEPLRDSLEKAVLDIDKELEMKQEEYGISAKTSE